MMSVKKNKTMCVSESDDQHHHHLTHVFFLEKSMGKLHALGLNNHVINA